MKTFVRSTGDEGAFHGINSRITLSETLVMSLFGIQPYYSFEAMVNPNQPGGFILLVDSTNPDAVFLKLTQNQTRPYVIALSHLDRPYGLTPQQFCEKFAIPETIKVLGYDWEDPKTMKQVVLELLDIMPQDELVQQAIEEIKRQISATS